MGFRKIEQHDPGLQMSEPFQVGGAVFSNVHNDEPATSCERLGNALAVMSRLPDDGNGGQPWSPEGPRSRGMSTGSHVLHLREITKRKRG